MNPIYVYWFILHISNVCISSCVQLNCRYLIFPFTLCTCERMFSIIFSNV